MTATTTPTFLPVTGLRLDVYRSRNDCTNGGITARDRFDTLVLVDPATAKADVRDLPNAVRIEVRTIGGPVATLVPVSPTVQLPSGRFLDRVDNLIGPMMGGHYAAVSDSRFADEIERLTGQRFYGALAVHDRYETPAQYRALSS